MERLAMRYYWPSAHRDVTKYVREWSNLPAVQGATTCTSRSDGGRRAVTRPWSVVAGDTTMGPFPRSAQGNEYIIIFMDLFTRWIEAIPVRKANARTIRKHLLERVFLRFGAPECVGARVLMCYVYTRRCSALATAHCFYNGDLTYMHSYKYVHEEQQQQQRDASPARTSKIHRLNYFYTLCRYRSEIPPERQIAKILFQAGCFANRTRVWLCVQFCYLRERPIWSEHILELFPLVTRFECDSLACTFDLQKVLAWMHYRIKSAIKKSAPSRHSSSMLFTSATFNVCVTPATLHWKLCSSYDALGTSVISFLLARQ
ncbi:unnamed protein product, partial [Trichogramma brassicae]